MLGFDPSLTSSGFAYRDRQAEITVGRIQPRGLTGVARLLYIRWAFVDILRETQTKIVAYEGYSMGSHSGRSFDMGELGGVLKTCAIQEGVSLLLVPPTVLKKFITGKGNAKKEQISQKIAERWGYNVPQNDEADALALLFFLEAGAVPANSSFMAKCVRVNP
jgi:Holliday junction resolvasome RuvABC endonuclease subunit